MAATPSLETCLPRAPEPSFTQVGAVLPHLGITKRRFKKLESICLVREQRGSGRQDLAFHARPFVLCGLPLRRPPANQLVHRRRNGKFFLHLVAHPDYGIPFGQDRLIPIWIATLALQQRSRTVRFRTASEMLNFFDLPLDGYHYQRTVEGFKRIFSATIFFGTEDHPSGASLIDWHRFHFLDQMKLWFNPGEQNHDDQSGGNVITLSEAFYDEIDQHRIPVERGVVSALAHAPGVFDLYLWIAWRSWGLNGGPIRVPLTGPAGLSQQLGTCEYTRNRRFRARLALWLSQVRAFWPACPASISPCGHFLVLHSSKNSPAITSV